MLNRVAQWVVEWVAEWVVQWAAVGVSKWVGQPSGLLGYANAVGCIYLNGAAAGRKRMGVVLILVFYSLKAIALN